MNRLHNQQLVVSGDLVMSSLNFNGSTTQTVTLPPPLPKVPFTQNGSAQGGTTSFIPSLHYALPVSDRWVLGLSLASPFGLNINYGIDSMLRYSANSANVKIYDVSPSFGFKVTDNFSVGAGVDFEYFDGKFDLTGGTPGLNLLRKIPASASDTLSHNTSTGWGYGWHAGLLYQFTEGTRVGLAYRSQVTFSPEGSSTFSGPLAGPTGSISNNNHQLKVTTPPITTLSAYHDFNPQWAIDGSVNYTQWNVFNNVLTLSNVLTPLPSNVSYPQSFHNTSRFAVGGQYHPVPKWIFRSAVAYDQSPMVNYHNTLQVDGDRIGVAIGAHYQATKAIGIDGGYTHLFIKDISVNTPSVSDAQTATPNGNVTSHADILGLQLT